MNWIPRFLAGWLLISLPTAILLGRSIAGRARVSAPSLDERLAPHVLSELDIRVGEAAPLTHVPEGWVEMSSARWPRG